MYVVADSRPGNIIIMFNDYCVLISTISRVLIRSSVISVTYYYIGALLCAFNTLMALVAQTWQ